MIDELKSLVVSLTASEAAKRKTNILDTELVLFSLLSKQDTAFSILESLSVDINALLSGLHSHSRGIDRTVGEGERIFTPRLQHTLKLAEDACKILNCPVREETLLYALVAGKGLAAIELAKFNVSEADIYKKVEKMSVQSATVCVGARYVQSGEEDVYRAVGLSHPEKIVTLERVEQKGSTRFIAEVPLKDLDAEWVKME